MSRVTFYCGNFYGLSAPPPILLPTPNFLAAGKRSLRPLLHIITKYQKFMNIEEILLSNPAALCQVRKRNW
jgi:hypothetical protein